MNKYLRWVDFGDELRCTHATMDTFCGLFDPMLIKLMAPCQEKTSNT